MAVDFKDAANRHWEDAELLFSNARLPNADQLFGLAAECALKAVMLGLGMQLSATGVPTNKQHKVHINTLWSEFITFANGNRGVAYAAILNQATAVAQPAATTLTGGSAQAHPFSAWDINQRYESGAGITNTTVEPHQRAAEAARRALAAALQNGDVK